MFSTKVIASVLALAAPCAFAVEQQRNLSFSSETAPPLTASVYSDGSFQGHVMSLPVGVYNYDFLEPKGFNDHIASVVVPAGLTVIMCSDPDFKGYCQTFTTAVDYFVVGDGVSSIEVVAGVLSPPPPAPVVKPPPPYPATVYSTKRTECLKKGYSHYQCQSHGYRNRNLKTVDTTFLAEDHKECMDVDYDMYLVVEGVHFAGLAVPLEQECPSVVLHSSIAEHDKSVEKVVMIADQEEVTSFDTDSMHHLGSRPFGSIVKAFDNAPVGKDGAKFYDSITNNCVSLLRNMADPLDVSVDDAMIAFVTKRLLSTNDIHLWDGIKNSPSLNLIVEGGKRMLKAANQEDLIRKLIKLYV